MATAGSAIAPLRRIDKDSPARSGPTLVTLCHARVSRRLACGALLWLFSAWSCDARADPALTIAISPQPVADALVEFAHQTGLQLVYVSAIVHARMSKGVPAGVAPAEALTQLLDGTGLRFEFLNARTVRIVESPTAKPMAQTSTREPPSTRVGSRAEATNQLDDVIVTGSGGDVQLATVPISISVWTREALALNGIKTTTQLASLTPGVEFDAYSDYGPGMETNIAIRGINAKDGSTTAVYLNDTSIPNDRASSFGRMYPVMFDLDRVEVLRGPQGVLLGEGAEGGAVRFVRAQPSLTTPSGFAQAEGGMTARGALTYEAGAAAGGPLIENMLGYRIGAWSRRDGGYVDRVDPFTGATVDKNANWSRSEATEVAVTLAPQEWLRITPSLGYQAVDLHDTSAFYAYLSNPARGVLRNGRLLDQWYTDRSHLESIKVSADVADVEVSAVSSLFHRRARAIADRTNNAFWGWANPMGPEYPVSYADAVIDPPQTLDEDVLSHQVRLASADSSARLAWTVGIDYAHAHYNEFQAIVTAALADGGYVNGATIVDRHTTQIAAYGLFELRVRDQLTATIGARVERESYESRQLIGGIAAVPGNPVFVFQDHATPVSPRFGLSYQPDDRELYYATAAKGYRMGGPNAFVGVGCTSTPTAYRPDAIWNYELGAKNSLLGARLQTDISVFHMRWRDIQTQIPYPDCGIGYTINAGAATSNGIDLGARAVLDDRLILGLTAAYADAHYTQTVLLNGAVVVGSGDAIGVVPLVSAPWSATATIDYQIPSNGAISFGLHADAEFHSRNPGPFTSDNPVAVVYAPVRRPDPSTSQLNLRATARWRHLELSIYVNNALDSQPTLQRRNYIASDTLFYATTLRPRTLGILGHWRL